MTRQTNVYSLARDGARMLGPHFALREFACRDGSDEVRVAPALIELLERIRAAAGGVPLVVSSGYRTPAYNQKVGGAPRSQHLLGTAADIWADGLSPLLAAQMAEAFLGERGGIGVYPTFTHVDVRPGRARWDSRSGRETPVSGWPGWEPPQMDNTPASAHREAVEWAAEQGLLLGDAQGDLGLSRPVTRQQLCSILFRYDRLR